MESKLKVGILGATGTVGQRFVDLLQGHPWFQIHAFGASERTAGKKYGDVVDWKVSSFVPAGVTDIVVELCEPRGRLGECALVFSALDASVAGEIEEKFAKADIGVFTNAKNHRLASDVPMVVPFVNPSHLDIIHYQRHKRGYKKGFIVTNSNCSTAGLVVPLKVLADRYGIEKLFVVTMQALSGAGYPGVPSLDILDNVIPYISGEEEKMQLEPLKILGQIEQTPIDQASASQSSTLQSNSTVDVSKYDYKFKYAPIQISAQCNRVHVLDGHTECVSVKLLKKPETFDEVSQLFSEFVSEVDKYKLPSAPKHPIIVLKQANRPQPRLDRNNGNGNSVSVGRIRECPLFDLRFVVLSHNTILGAAGCAILNAELCKAKGFL